MKESLAINNSNINLNLYKLQSCQLSSFPKIKKHTWDRKMTFTGIEVH